MRRWYVPLTVLGLGGIGVLVMSERGREVLRRLADQLYYAPEKLEEWNEAAQRELDRIQAALERVAETLQAAQ